MQVPERLALIGGGILLSSTLVFTLKSQASQILPKISQSISAIQDRTSDTQNGNNFSDSFQQAQKDNFKTGTWGSSKYYIDKDNNLHVGTGNLHGRLYDTLGQDVYNIQSINFDGNVQAPSDSYQLLSGVDNPDYNSNYSIKTINGLDRLDTSQVTSLFYLFANDSALRGVDLSHWNTSNVTNMDGMFINNVGLADLKAGNLNTTKVNNLGWMFLRDSSLQKIDLSGWHINGDNNPNMVLTFGSTSNLKELDISNFDTTNNSHDDNLIGWGTGNNLQKLVLSDKTTFRDNTGTINGTWKNGNQTVQGSQFQDNTAHPGTWTKQ